MTLFDLSRKVAIVTGSSRGIGRASAEADEIAGAVVYPAAPASSFMTGQMMG